MIPPTKNGLPRMACLSALQKAIRRSLEVDAMRFAVELIHSDQAGCTMVLNRLQIIAQEDIDCVKAPHVVPFMAASAELAPKLYKKNPENPGGARMVVGNMIRVLCAAPKSRVADHFQAAIGLAALLEGRYPEIPDYANDLHTMAGKRLGRGLEHFRTEGTKLIEPDGSVVPEDEYADEAYRLWELKRGELGAKGQGRAKCAGR